MSNDTIYRYRQTTKKKWVIEGKFYKWTIRWLIPIRISYWERVDETGCEYDFWNTYPGSAIIGEQNTERDCEDIISILEINNKLK